MILIQNGFKCEYEMNIFINIFFKSEENGTIKTDFSHKNDLINVHTSIDFEGNIYESDYAYSFKNSEKDAKIIKKIYSCACTKSFISSLLLLRAKS